MSTTTKDETMRDRACTFASTADLSNPEAGARLLQEFAEAEVRLALQPREPSPELAEAEKWLAGMRGYAALTSARKTLPGIVAAELDRLRAENALALDGGGCEKCGDTGKIVVGHMSGPGMCASLMNRCKCMDRKPSVTWSDERKRIVSWLRTAPEDMDINSEALIVMANRLADAIEHGDHTVVSKSKPPAQERAERGEPKP